MKHLDKEQRQKLLYLVQHLEERIGKIRRRPPGGYIIEGSPQAGGFVRTEQDWEIEREICDKLNPCIDDLNAIVRKAGLTHWPIYAPEVAYVDDKEWQENGEECPEYINISRFLSIAARLRAEIERFIVDTDIPGPEEVTAVRATPQNPRAIMQSPNRVEDYSRDTIAIEGNRIFLNGRPLHELPGNVFAFIKVLFDHKRACGNTNTALAWKFSKVGGYTDGIHPRMEKIRRVPIRARGIHGVFQKSHIPLRKALIARGDNKNDFYLIPIPPPAQPQS